MIQNTNWTASSVVNPSELPAQRFARLVVKVAKEAKVPKYKQTSRRAEKLNRMWAAKIEQHHKQMNHPHCTKKDKDELASKVEVLNERMLTEHERDLEAKEKEAIKKIKGDPKQFYKYANQNKKIRSRIGPLKSGNSYYSGAKQMAQILSDQYKSVFSKQKTDYSYMQLPVKDIQSLSDIEMTKVMFEMAMSDTNRNSASGPDGIPAFFFHTFATELAGPVIKMWRQSLDTGRMPDGTSLAWITRFPRQLTKASLLTIAPLH